MKEEIPFTADTWWKNVFNNSKCTMHFSKWFWFKLMWADWNRMSPSLCEQFKVWRLALTQVGPLVVNWIICGNCGIFSVLYWPEQINTELVNQWKICVNREDLFKRDSLLNMFESFWKSLRRCFSFGNGQKLCRLFFENCSVNWTTLFD